jgi:hypothetical protein
MPSTIEVESIGSYGADPFSAYLFGGGAVRIDVVDACSELAHSWPKADLSSPQLDIAWPTANLTADPHAGTQPTHNRHTRSTAGHRLRAES